jgi:urease alpha subunit
MELTPREKDKLLVFTAEEMEVQVAIHTDTLNESGFVEASIKAFKCRTLRCLAPCGRGLRTSVTFVSAAAPKNPALASLGLSRPLEAVKNTRRVKKKDMVHNDWQPKIDVDPETYEVRADGEPLACEPAKALPMAQRYFLF